MVIGEAARSMNAEMRDRYPSIPWGRIMGFRNFAVHEYFAVEWNIVWAIAHRDVPTLEKQVFSILAVEYPNLAAPLERSN